MGCRLPGGIDGPEGLWRFLVGGRSAVGPIPPERWAAYATDPDARRRAAARRATGRGAFLDDAAGFDAEFFGVTPREAELIDPQQRLALEVGWEALEDAGIPPDRLAGTGAGVFVGVGSDDYGRQMLEDLPAVEAWSGIGASLCGVANRLSYALDLRGPSLAVDTACSASLVAIHLACQSLRAGECELALAGGVNLIAAPGLTLALDAAGATAPDGRSKPFDAAADGYGRGEGIGIVVLARLADARRDGDRVRAVIRGSAVSQDGRTAGIMAPSGDAQERVMRRALDQAGVEPESVGFVEAHGTGTRAGDPIELGAVGRVYGRGAGGSTGEPCLVGSVKPNVGHLEAGAGVAGVIKAALALEHGIVPPTPVGELDPAVDWDGLGLRVATEAVPWRRAAGPRRAGVSGFGYGGTVAHVVLEEPADDGAGPPPAEPAGGPLLFALSSASEEGVRAEAASLASWLAADGAGVPLPDVAHTLLARRAHLPHRAAVVADDRPSLRAALTHVAEGRPDALATTARRLADTGPSALWVFSGHGSQWPGMGRTLLRDEPAFRDTVRRLDPIFRAGLGVTAGDALRHDPLTAVDVVQPLIFAVQVGLDAVLRDRGLEPGAVVGHSVGEIAAAVAAGVLPVEDAARLVCRRSVLLRRVVGRGAMAMVGLPAEEVADRLAGGPAGCAGVAVAILAAPESTVISGSPPAVAALCDEWSAGGVMVRPLASDVAFHGPQMDPLVAPLAAAGDELDPAVPGVRLYSTALVDPRSDAPRDGRYWAANLREPVRLDAAIRAAAADGHRAFVEVAPHPVVTHSIAETLADAGLDDVVVTGTLRRDRPESATLLAAAGSLHAHGAVADPARLAPAPSGRAPAGPAPLPRRAWRHRPYWRTPTPPPTGAGHHDADSATLLGTPVTVAGDPSLRVWQTDLDMATRPYPGSHPIHGVEVVPAAVLLNTFLAAGATRSLTGVRLDVPLAVSGERTVQVVLRDRELRIASRPRTDADGSWTTHTVASLAPPAGALPAADPPALAEREPAAVTERLQAAGVGDVGFPWRVERLAGGEGAGEVVATVRPDPGGEASDGGWAALLDAVLSVAPLAFSGDVLRMPAAIERVEVGERCPALAIVHVRRRGGDTVDVRLAGDAGGTVGVLDGVRFAVLDDDTAAGATPVSPRRLVHRLDWVAVEPPPESRPPLRAVAVVGDERGDMAEALADRKLRCLPVDVPEGLGDVLDELGQGDAVLVLPATPHDREPVGDVARRSAWRLAAAAQALVRGGGGRPPRLWAVTRGRDDVAEGAMSGLARVVAGEHPELGASVVELDDRSGATVDTLVRLLRGRPEPDGYAAGPDGVRAARLVPLTGEPVTGPLRCRADGTYLVTGGLGALGAVVAEWLVGRGARRLVLTGRTGLPARSEWDRATDPGARQRIDTVRKLEALGASVRVLAFDVADREAARRALDADELGLPPIRGIVHAAGVLDDRMVSELDEASLRTVTRAKLDGALVLDELFPPGSVDLFALFSSVGLQLGLTGQASYAAANAGLDALARRRRRAGDPGAISLAWTSWRGLGMAVSDVVDLELADRGAGSVAPGDALRAWELASRFDLGYAAIVPVTAASGERPAILRDAVPAGEHGGDGGGHGDGDGGGPIGDVRALGPAELLAEVARQIEGELRLGPGRLDPHRPLTELGLDSVMTLVIRRGLERRFGLRLPATLLWNHPTAAAVAGHLADRLAPERPADPPPGDPADPADHTHHLTPTAPE